MIVLYTTTETTKPQPMIIEDWLMDIYNEPDRRNRRYGESGNPATTRHIHHTNKKKQVVLRNRTKK
jgi:hypothetical protein